MAHLKLQVENGLEVASLLSIVAVAREWREAMHVQAASAVRSVRSYTCWMVHNAYSLIPRSPPS